MNLIERAKHIIVNPKREWEVISAETSTTKQVMLSYVLPFALAGAAAAFIGYGFLAGEHTAMGYAAYRAIALVVLNILSVFATASVIDMLAPSFASEKNFARSVKLVAYSTTPSLVGALLAIYPPVAIIGSLFGLYGIYLWYLGLGPIKHTPDDKKVIYIVVSVIVLIVVWVIIGALLEALLFPLFGLNSLSRFGGI